VKVDLFPDEVFVFTPKGEVVNLPKGATPVDFAYAIHSEVGAHCQGAKVNGKLVQLRHPLQDGDTVEIVTSPQQQPRKDWLEFVVSGRARQKIRHAIRQAEQARSRELGREMLDRELRRAGLSLARLVESGGLDEVARLESGGGLDDLFSAVGYGRVPAMNVVRRLKPDAAPPPDPAAAAQPAERPRRLGLFRRRPAPSRSGLRVSGQSDVLVRFAACCGPLPGDDVVGFVTRGRGVTVHSKDCPKVFALDPDRRIDVAWDAEASVPRRIKVRVVSVDRPGILATVTKTISAAGLNIDAARVATTPDGKAVSSFDVWVSDVRTLNTVMKDIGKTKGVLTVERVRS
jgi:GTP pyrophosphokinase